MHFSHKCAHISADNLHFDHGIFIFHKGNRKSKIGCPFNRFFCKSNFAINARPF